ncbi:hypothetical protein B0T18DRAFT_61389 [Schizothecium vesticola]|uniref:Ubiquitin-like protein smt3 n=1 Tax=Schizothecium vesticola TaxID=314040 RepID=A0AA40K9J7_9PEZI|nr:hypothetical protein B0T18DRAFT_61389 [Schizothecium vesticola]
MASSSKSDTIASSLGKLSIETSSSKEKAPCAAKEKRAAVADSWEDEDASSESEPEDDKTAGASGVDREARSGTSAPPPTPMNATYNDAVMAMSSQSIPGSVAPGGAREVKRPEKTDAVARRMIASALGVKVPRLTEDQKKYDQAVREKERRRRAEEKERLKKEEEEALKAKQAVWED